MGAARLERPPAGDRYLFLKARGFREDKSALSPLGGEEASMESWRADFSKMKAWPMAFAIRLDVYKATGKFPAAERFGLASQMRRAASGIPTSIAEGFARRRPRDKGYFYTVARSSGEELKSELMISRHLGYLDTALYEGLIARLDEVCRMLYGLIESMERKASGSVDSKPSQSSP
jgi:four helix bundle protein